MNLYGDGGYPPIGDFRHSGVIGFFEPSLEDTFPTATHFGLVQDGTYLYGGFRDDDGVLYNVIRKVAVESTLGVLLNTTLDGGGLGPHPDSAKGFRGQVVQSIEGSAHIAEGSPRSSRKHFHFRRTLDGVEWDEGPVLSVTGRLIGPGQHWYDPWRGGGAMYTSHIHRASGEVLGRKVEGFLAWDQFWAPPGMTWFASPHYRGLEVAWFTLANEYEDGTIEVGQICHGAQDWGFAMLANQDGPLLLTHDVTAAIAFDQNEYPRRAEFRLAGEEFEWVAEPNAAVPAITLGPDIYRPAEGMGRKVGDTRAVRVWFGWLDTFNDGRS